MRELGRRIARLEAEASSGGASMHVINCMDGESEDEAIAAAGINPRPDDLVVLLRHFATSAEPAPPIERIVRSPCRVHGKNRRSGAPNVCR